MNRLSPLFVVLIVVATSAVANDSPTPGLYAITAQVSSKQLPISNTHNSQECFKDQEFMKDPEAWMKKQPGQDCEIVEYDVSGGNIRMELRCSIAQGGNGTIVGTGTYTDDGFTMNNQMKMQSHGMTMEINTTVTGERQGSC